MQQLAKAITIGARDSNLSKAQVQELLQELRCFYPEISFNPIYVKTAGDIDQKTSLRTLDKTDFFTREIDQMLLQGTCRVGVHSAKDLPDPLPKSLCLAALTKGVDPSDSLVFREKDSLDSLPRGAKIATSSQRREECVREMRKDLTFVDIRGNIEKRLEKLFTKDVDGVVIAESALIRLKLTHLNRISLPGATATHQGRLAVIVREADAEMKKLFHILHHG